jgi:hypothetical protein
MNENLTLAQLLKAAEEASNNDVPVDWRQLTYLVYSQANKRITELEGLIPKQCEPLPY